MMEPVSVAQFVQQFEPYMENDMSAYTNLPTPPMSSSEGSRSPLTYSYNGSQIVPQYVVQGMILDDRSDMPYLEIIEQPVEKFRFRYKSEMAGTHGSLCGNTSERNRKQTYPTVRLKNFNRPAVVRCSLYQWNPHTGPELWQPHAHRLVQKCGSEEVDDPHDKRIDQPHNQDIVFNNMGIIHTAKKFLVGEMFKKKQKLMVEQIKRNEGRLRDLKTSEVSELQREANEESKSINLNIVCLRFDAFEEKNGVMELITPPVYSHAINNLKSALTGELKITRMSRSSSPACGNKEIFLLVEKVTKKNIKVRLFEMDDDDNELWSAYGKFHDNDVHHQYAIVASIPAYRDANIQEDVRVYIELERPSDGAKSAPLEFTYHPDRMSRRKRPRMYNSSTSFSSSEIPSTLHELDPFLSSKELQEAAKGVDSEEFQQLFASVDMNELGVFQTDTTHKLHELDKTWPEAEKLILRVFKEFDSFFKTNPTDQRIVKMLETHIGKKIDRSGNNALHLSYMYLSLVEKEKLIEILKLLIKFKLVHLLNAINKSRYTLLHIAIEKGCDFYLSTLAEVMDLSIKNCKGLTALHLAVQKDFKYEEILKSPNVKNYINITSDRGDTALQLAVLTDNLKAVQALCKAGADVNVIDRKSGDSLVHMCVHRMNPASQDIVKYLIDNTKINLTTKNFADTTCLAATRSSSEELAVKMSKLIEDKLNSMGLCEETYIKQEPESDEERIETDTEVKFEHLSEDDIRELYGQVIQFTPDCLEQVSKMLNVNDKWKALPPLLDLHYVLATHVFDGNENPTTAFINFALANGVSVYQIRTNLVFLNEFDAVKHIDDMVLNSE